MPIFAIILAVIKAIPAIQSFVDSFIVFYTNSEIDKMSASNLAAIKKVLNDKDQRDLEKAIGSPTAGKPSGDAGAVILPGPPK